MNCIQKAEVFGELLVYLGGTLLCFWLSSALFTFGTYHVSFSCPNELGQEQTLTVCGVRRTFSSDYINEWLPGQPNSEALRR